MKTVDVDELHNDFIRRAEACDGLARKHRAAFVAAGGDLIEACDEDINAGRCDGKASAYRHAAELLRAAEDRATRAAAGRVAR